MKTAELVRPGLYVLRGITHADCGGEIRAERCGSGEFRWECFCVECKECDPNGWPTLKDCIREAPRYWSPR